MNGSVVGGTGTARRPRVGSGRRTRPGVTALLLLLPLLPISGAEAQERVPSVSGLVMDGGAETPVPEVLVRLYRADGDGRGTEAPPLRTTLTDAEGVYRFERIAPGSYLVVFSRIGYRESRIRLRIRDREAVVSVGLEVAPVSLAPVDVVGPGSRLDPHGDADPGSISIRPDRALSPGARELTLADLRGSVPLAETDLLRAIQRLPGVTSPTEWSAEVWVRGSTFDETRVLFDGIPVLDPLHAGGMFSAINPDALASATLYGGVRPPALSGGGAAVLDVRSRAPRPEGDLLGAGEVSLASARLTLERGWEERDVAAMVGIRRSYVDWLARAFGTPAHYRFSDLLARVDAPAGDGTIEVSGLLQSDRISGDVPDVFQDEDIHWGNLVGRITDRRRVRGGSLATTLGTSRHTLVSEDIPRDPDATIRTEDLPPIDHGLSYAVFRQAWDDGTWTVGWEVTARRVRYTGERPRPYAGLATGTNGVVETEDDLRIASGWMGWEGAVGGWGALRLALRAEGGDGVASGEAVRLAPVAELSVRPAEGLGVRLGAARSFQYVQAIAPYVLHQGDFPAGYVRTLAGREVPPLRSDAVVVEVNAEVGGGWTGEVVAYGRRTRGRLVPAPEAGSPEGRPLHVTAEGTAFGIETAVERSGPGGWISGSYAYGVSEDEVDGIRRPADGDLRHQVKAAGGVSLGDRFRLSGAVTWTSGLPYTRVVELCASFCFERLGSWVSEGNAFRRRGTLGADVALEWSTRLGPAEVEAFLQVRNLLRRENRGRYRGESFQCPGEAGGACVPTLDHPPIADSFTHGVPLLPLLGARFRF